ncbi:Uncharacterized protein SCF082_LOCUS12504, partial [Durusdinium trenchii]
SLRLTAGSSRISEPLHEKHVLRFLLGLLTFGMVVVKAADLVNGRRQVVCEADAPPDGLKTILSKWDAEVTHLDQRCDLTGRTALSSSGAVFRAVRTLLDVTVGILVFNSRRGTADVRLVAGVFRRVPIYVAIRAGAEPTSSLVAANPALAAKSCVQRADVSLCFPEAFEGVGGLCARFSQPGKPLPIPVQPPLRPLRAPCSIFALMEPGFGPISGRRTGAWRVAESRRMKAHALVALVALALCACSASALRAAETGRDLAVERLTGLDQETDADKHVALLSEAVMAQLGRAARKIGKGFKDVTKSVGKGFKDLFTGKFKARKDIWKSIENGSTDAWKDVYGGFKDMDDYFDNQFVDDLEWLGGKIVEGLEIALCSGPPAAKSARIFACSTAINAATCIALSGAAPWCANVDLLTKVMGIVGAASIRTLVQCTFYYALKDQVCKGVASSIGAAAGSMLTADPYTMACDAGLSCFCDSLCRTLQTQTKRERFPERRALAPRRMDLKAHALVALVVVALCACSASALGAAATGRQLAVERLTGLDQETDAEQHATLLSEAVMAQLEESSEVETEASLLGGRRRRRRRLGFRKISKKLKGATEVVGNGLNALFTGKFKARKDIWKSLENGSPDAWKDVYGGFKDMDDYFDKQFVDDLEWLGGKINEGLDIALCSGPAAAKTARVTVCSVAVNAATCVALSGSAPWCADVDLSTKVIGVVGAGVFRNLVHCTFYHTLKRQVCQGRASSIGAAAGNMLTAEPYLMACDTVFSCYCDS